mmetsp:Transcript_17938/g.30517  ORF Transcript_17938/g.30517 Transcript_17938/m.30517 type:complete len:88 (+) Transcript_17938:1132-1395(+)
METFREHGYYSMYLKNKEGELLGEGKNTKLISLNTNFCYHFNWNSYLMYQDPAHILHWLVEELEEVRARKGSAILVGHVPNGEECGY